MTTEKSLIVPVSTTSTNQTTELKTKSSFLFIGANGSGKTRCGTWIEINSLQQQQVHRISAQKLLSMRDSVVPLSIDAAEKNLLYGDIFAKVIKSNNSKQLEQLEIQCKQNKKLFKQNYKWKQQQPAICSSNDYEALMIYLFSEKIEKNDEYYKLSKKSKDKIEAVDNFPEGLLIEILGSRKPIVFVEGENGKFDVTLYRLILDKFLVIPRGSCTQVIQSIKALKNSPQLHHLEVHGIIDRDRRSELEIQALIENGVYVLEVAEVENLFCTPEILEFASEKLARNFDQDFTEVKNHIFNNFKQELENQVSLKTASEIKFQLNCFSEKVKGKSELETELNSVVNDISVSEIYDSTYGIFQAIIENKDYDKLLCYYNRKSLAKQISGAFGLKNNELVESIIRYAQKNDGDRNEIKNRLKRYFGAFSQNIN